MLARPVAALWRQASRLGAAAARVAAMLIGSVLCDSPPSSRRIGKIDPGAHCGFCGKWRAESKDQDSYAYAAAL